MENQPAENDPPVTGEVLEALLAQGLSRHEDAVSEAHFAVNLSRLNAESSITLALQEIRKRVAGLAVEDVRGDNHKA
ncbi:MAG: hypothetical protein U9Q70_10115 [Chloroflexota bacterium]|nr:hypothetical protein [Chloroflexota bacterium]